MRGMTGPHSGGKTRGPRAGCVGFRPFNPMVRQAARGGDRGHHTDVSTRGETYEGDDWVQLFLTICNPWGQTPHPHLTSRCVEKWDTGGSRCLCGCTAKKKSLLHSPNTRS